MLLNLVQHFAQTADSLVQDCPAGQTLQDYAKAHQFFGLPPWYEFLKGKLDALGKCTPYIDTSKGFTGFLPIGLAILDMLLRIAGLVAVGFIIYSGFMYVTSQGEPDATTKAKDGIINALVGLGIAIVASAAVAFIGGQLK